MYKISVGLNQMAVADKTKVIALEVVNNADKNVFDGKGTTHQEKEHKHQNHYKERKIQTRVNTNRDYSDDSWESF